MHEKAIFSLKNIKKRFLIQKIRVEMFGRMDTEGMT